MFKQVIAVTVIAAASGAAMATGHCPIDKPAPQGQWQPKEALEKKLAAQGWDIRRIKIDDACYEVYAKDDKGRKVEAYFDPKTLEPAQR